MGRVFALFALGLLTAGCGPIPQPFQGTKKVSSDIAFLDVPSAVGIASAPVMGVPQPLNQEFTKAIAQALEPYEIPAEATASNKGLGFSLQGQVMEPTRKDGVVNASVMWTLKSRKGQSAGVYIQTIAVPIQDWEKGGGSTATRLGRDTAAGIAGIIEGSTNQAAGGVSTAPDRSALKADVPPPVRITVKPVEGAPGDGRDSLQAATLESLLANGAKRDDVNPEVVLMGRVEIQASVNNQDFVTIAWRAITQDGADLGEVKLTNTIPHGSLDGRWGGAAFTIVDAGLAQLLALLAVAPRF